MPDRACVLRAIARIDDRPGLGPGRSGARSALFELHGRMEFVVRLHVECSELVRVRLVMAFQGHGLAVLADERLLIVVV